MNENGNTSAAVGRKTRVLQSATGDIKAERHECFSTLKEWPCRPEGSKHERHVEKKIHFFPKKHTLTLFPPLLQYIFPCAMSYPAKLIPEIVQQSCFAISAYEISSGISLRWSPTSSHFMSLMMAKKAHGCKNVNWIFYYYYY